MRLPLDPIGSDRRGEAETRALAGRVQPAPYVPCRVVEPNGPACDAGPQPRTAEHQEAKRSAATARMRWLCPLPGPLVDDNERSLCAVSNTLIAEYRATGAQPDTTSIIAALTASRESYARLRARVLASPATTPASVQARGLIAKTLADYEAALSALESAAQADPSDASSYLRAASQHLAQARSTRKQATALLGGAWPL